MSTSIKAFSPLDAGTAEPIYRQLSWRFRSAIADGLLKPGERIPAARALAKELGSILSGGTAPLVAAALLTWTGHWWAIAGYFVAMAGIGFVTTFVAPETRGRDLNALEDAI